MSKKHRNENHIFSGSSKIGNRIMIYNYLTTNSIQTSLNIFFSISTTKLRYIVANVFVLLSHRCVRIFQTFSIRVSDTLRQKKGIKVLMIQAMAKECHNLLKYNLKSIQKSSHGIQSTYDIFLCPRRKLGTIGLLT